MVCIFMHKSVSKYDVVVSIITFPALIEYPIVAGLVQEASSREIVGFFTHSSSESKFELRVKNYSGIISRTDYLAATRIEAASVFSMVSFPQTTRIRF